MSCPPGQSRRKPFGKCVRGTDEEEEEDKGASNWLSAFMIRYKARQRQTLMIVAVQSFFVF